MPANLSSLKGGGGWSQFLRQQKSVVFFTYSCSKFVGFNYDHSYITSLTSWHLMNKISVISVEIELSKLTQLGGPLLFRVNCDDYVCWHKRMCRVRTYFSSQIDFQFYEHKRPTNLIWHSFQAWEKFGNRQKAKNTFILLHISNLCTAFLVFTLHISNNFISPQLLRSYENTKNKASK